MDKAGLEFNERREEEAAKIKAKFDELAKSIKIDSKGLISALLRKKEVSLVNLTKLLQIAKSAEVVVCI
jgi:hypothetical protein